MAATYPPVVVDVGKQKSKDLKALMNGGGPLMEDVAHVMEDIRLKSAELADKDLVPVVLIYRKKPKKAGMSMMPPFNLMK